MRLIDADALFNAISVHLERIEQEIDDAPTIDPVKHGRWKHEHLVSTCGGTYAVVRCSLCDWQYPTFETDFCPHCGARMDGDDNEID